MTETSKQHEQNNRILLEEVETQEFEIERLFKENSHLHSQLEELATVTRYQAMMHLNASMDIQTLEGTSMWLRSFRVRGLFLPQCTQVKSRVTFSMKGAVRESMSICRHTANYPFVNMQ